MRIFRLSTGFTHYTILSIECGARLVRYYISCARENLVGGALNSHTCYNRPVSYRTQMLIVEGHRIETAAYGPSPAEAPTLVFLHEGLGCVSMWKEFPKRLSEITGCGTVIYSRLGYGKSGPSVLPRPVAFVHDEASRLLPQFLKQAETQEHLLIGHSDGGSIALIYAGINQPERLAGIITENPNVFCENGLVQ